MNKKQGIFLALMLLFQGNILATSLEDKVGMLAKGFKVLADKITILEQQLPCKTTKKAIRKPKKAADIDDRENKKPR